ncbi:hypothetical protein [Mesorhizobium sp.]|uniref:hypothetical protein n=1 Tax=Mesorhizobium sp. TaxID=1871066 RepID=UPI00257E1533|nr:hypothetical protein [Mesorhizobium sp.]
MAAFVAAPPTAKPLSSVTKLAISRSLGWLGRLGARPRCQHHDGLPVVDALTYGGSISRSRQRSFTRAKKKKGRTVKVRPGMKVQNLQRGTRRTQWEENIRRNAHMGRHG